MYTDSEIDKLRSNLESLKTQVRNSTTIEDLSDLICYVGPTGGEDEKMELEKLFIKATIEYLIKNGFTIKNQDGSQFDMQEFLDLYFCIFEKNYRTDKAEQGEEILLKIIDANHDDGFISFMPSICIKLCSL